MATKKATFNQLIFDAFGQKNVYDKVAYELNRIRDIMVDKHPSFSKMSSEKQFEYCITINLVVASSTNHALAKASIFRDEKDSYFEYSVMRDYSEPEILKLEQLKLGN